MFAIRFVELAVFIRVMSRREFSFAQINGFDRSFVLLYLVTTLIFLVRSNELLAFQIGEMLDAYLCYFAFRGLVVNFEDFQWFLRAMLILLVPYAVLVLFESVTSRNLFSVLGSIESTDWMREGRLRCTGSFRHPSLLGTVGACFLPLYLALYSNKTSRIFSYVGIGVCISIVYASNSGGPISCAMVAIIGWLLWKVRTKMQMVRRLILLIIVILGLFMKAPIWYIPAKASALTGGDGWHRSYLMDVSFQHFSEWWLAGMTVEGTASWFPYIAEAVGGADMTNQYLDFGITAGVLPIILFFAMLIRAYSLLGKSMAITRIRQNTHGGFELMLWGLGVMLAVHIFNWLGIIYFDQTYVILYLQLSVISSLTGIILNATSDSTTTTSTVPAIVSN